ncbi:MAG: protein TolR [Syntrophotalea acetylenica]|jgi:biopolymer transport protein TolR|uniref:Protein TolR n=1 Tax=Syntrophotalea acetylenica TaxID=29542 RepID=A0A1L3GGP2_SYNAC|nr:protein TolR [Syntrophotalea acetylenica]APG24838.1 protein TolR [Syntrophotalea acetylenica]APG42898.1 protein TolR [Syntrophotalea acetylenica]MDD4456962.1 protein TolR [Syntrophotalea acetylenica]MDY0261350.1 protein TolR [Syntrophotalea acetylenica]
MEVGQRNGTSRSTLSAINVTPLVDVMLVLLIIFMVTAPMLEQGVEVNLPEVSDAPGLQAGKEPLIVTVEQNGAISIGKQSIPGPEKLVPVLLEILQSRQEKEVFLQADRDVPYGKVVQVMAAIKGAGIEKLGMVSMPPDPEK